LNVHSLLDTLSVGSAALATRRTRFFRDDLASPALPELVRSTRIDAPGISGEGTYQVRAQTAAGEMDPAFRVVRWIGTGRPTLIFHHGNNERPFDPGVLVKNTFRRVVLNAGGEFDANLIVLRAPLHRSFDEYRQRIGRLVDFAAMIAASACLVEHLVGCVRAEGGGPVVMAGISLGGWVTNLHRACFNTADSYVPLLAGAALGEVFVSSAYRRLTAARALRQPDVLRGVLNFEGEFARVTDDNVFPLLARHDAIVQYERQHRCYGGRPIEVLERGHVTGALAAGPLRRHLLGVIRAAALRSLSDPDPEPTRGAPDPLTTDPASTGGRDERSS
jgi:hypothetical protein